MIATVPAVVDPAAFTEVARDATSLTLRLVAAAARAACDGHFPGDPLIPGSRLAGYAADTAAALLARDGTPWRLAGVARATFAAPARPTALIAFRATRTDAAGGVVVDVTGDGVALARVVVRFEAAA